MDKLATDIENWTQFEMNEGLAETLVANGFQAPTEVQAKSLVYLQSRLDLVIAAKTGQGKTLCFGIPILDALIKKVQKVNAAQKSESDEEEKQGERKRAEVFDGAKALIISPTRELALQIQDMIQAVIPTDCQD